MPGRTEYGPTYSAVKSIAAATEFRDKHATRRAKHDKKGKTSNEPLSDKELEQLTALVQQGIGFNAERLPMANGAKLGLTQMQQRVTAAGGTFTVSSIPTQGTTLQAKIPLVEIVPDDAISRTKEVA